MTTLTSPHDLLAAIPFLVGFKPEDSIVLMSIKDDSIFMALRIDFPDSLDPEQIDTLVSHLQRDDADAAISVYYIPESSSDADLLIKTITDAIDEKKIPLRESLIVHANRWRSLICEDKVRRFPNLITPELLQNKLLLENPFLLKTSINSSIQFQLSSQTKNYST
ncbi:MAG: hypothetical protein RL611_815 [Actinomycetota bacterium]